MPAVEGLQMDDLLLKLAFARGGGPKKQAKQKPAWNDAVEAVVSAYGGKKKPKPPKQAPSRWKAPPRPGRKPLAPKRNARPAKKPAPAKPKEKVLPEVPGAEPTRPAVPQPAAPRPRMPAKPQGPRRPAAPGRRVVIDPGPPGINPRPPAGCPKPEATQPLTEDAAAAFVRLNGGGEIRGLKLFEDTVNIRVELDIAEPPTEPEEATAEPTSGPSTMERPESEPVAAPTPSTDAPEEPQPVAAPTEAPEPVAAPTPSKDVAEESQPITAPTEAPEPVAAPSPSEASMDGSIVMALATPPNAPEEPSTDAPEEPVQPARFAVGARVEARFEAGETWYAGVIERVDGDAYDVAYDDGDHESNVAAALVREEVVTTRSLDVGPTPEPTSPEPSAPEPTASPTPKRPERTIDVAPPRRPPAEPRESAELLTVADAEDASDGGTALPPGPTATQTTDGYGDDDFEDFTETRPPGARTLGAASKLQDAVLGWLEYKRCDAPPEKTEWTLNEVRASVCVDGEVSSASFEKLGWKVCHQALTRLKAPNRGPTKDLADRLAIVLKTS